MLTQLDVSFLETSFIYVCVYIWIYTFWDKKHYAFRNYFIIDILLLQWASRKTRRVCTGHLFSSKRSIIKKNSYWSILWKTIYITNHRATCWASLTLSISQNLSSGFCTCPRSNSEKNGWGKKKDVVILTTEKDLPEGLCLQTLPWRSVCKTHHKI